MTYSQIMDDFTIQHGDDWRPKFEHARLYGYLPPFTDEETFLRMASYYTQEKSYKSGYAAVLHKELFKRWPDGHGWRLLEPLEPSEDFLDWMDARAQRMRISRSRKKSGKTKRKS